MKKFQFAWLDVAIGAVVSVLMLAVFALHLADGLENKLYDWRAQKRATTRDSENVVFIGIDDTDLQKLGRWPWPRSYMAEMIDQLTDAQAKVIVIDVAYTQAESN